MANAKKCDRCGDFYGIEPNKRSDIKVVKGSEDCYPETIDLCPKCLLKLKNFLTGGDFT